MKRSIFLTSVYGVWLTPIVLVLSLLFVRANPPAPYTLITGLVRDQYGTPLTSAKATVLFQTQSGVVVSGQVLPGYAPGINYLLRVPMDSGQTPDPYEADAQFGGAKFKLWVVLNNTTNLPIEMSGVFDQLGKPGAQVRINLTLGVDSNGDGIPDAWENGFLAALGLNLPLSSLNANSVLTPDGLTLRQQYVFGAYPFNPSEPCKVTFAGFRGSSPHLVFPTVTGRSYTVLSSSDTRTWNVVPFYLPTDDSAGPARNSYYSPGVGSMEVYVVPSAAPSTAQFYRVLVQ